MRRVGSHLFPLISILLLFSIFSYGQSWSNILASSRAINWGNAGLPAILPDGETTPNPWTPPARTQCGSTIAAGASAPTINAALAACGTGTYVLLGAGTFTFSSTNITMYAQNGVTLRGSGAQSTTVVLTGTSSIQFGISWNNGNCTWASGFSAGTTSITLTGCTLQPVVGQILNLTQCDSGYGGSSCASGSNYDNGGLYVCGFNTTNNQNSQLCQYPSQGSGPEQHQQQTVYASAVSGTCSLSCTVTISPGLYMPNWNATVNSQNATPQAIWTTSCSASNCATNWGTGLEDITVYSNTGATASNPVAMTQCYACWVKGVRLIGASADNSPIFVSGTKNSLLFNNYVFADYLLDNNLSANLIIQTSSDDLVLNNLETAGTAYNGFGSVEGNVLAYNYDRDALNAFYENSKFEHHPGSAFELGEGNEIGIWNEDDTHGTHSLNTEFRSYISGGDLPLTECSGSCEPRGVELEAYARFDNSIGNAIGGSLLTTYQSSTAGAAAVFLLDAAGGSDPLVASSLMRWGNCDTVTGTCRFQSSEVPTTLTGNAAPFENTVPSNNNLPCSFFLPGYSSTTCSPHPSGGTGLSWWKVCKTWTTFPTACATSQLQPYPPIGPDVTGGSYVNGTAYDIPAAVAFKNLPIDTRYQNSYSITASSWSSGTETLTVSGFPSGSIHIMGPMQISGGSCATSGAGSSTGAEVYISASTATSVSYALASNPGSCTGTMLFPDIRQFDERVYQNDPSGNPPPAPTGLAAQVN